MTPQLTSLCVAITLSLSGLALAPAAMAHGDAEADAEPHAEEDEAMHGEPGHHGDEGGQHNGGHHEGGHAGQDADATLEEMREMHRGHDHAHDFEAMEHLSPEERGRVLALMRDLGLALPPLDPARGRELFLEKGCIACHKVNGVGGDLGPTLNAEAMPETMNAFEFAARMWRGAAAMTDLQRQMLGDVITLNGRDLANIIAFAHDEEEQAKLIRDDVPEEFRSMIGDQ